MRINFIPRLLFAPDSNTGGGTPTPDDIALVEKLVSLYQKYYGMTEAIAKKKAEEARAQGILNKEIALYQDALEDIAFQSDYIFRSFQETTNELKNQNLLLNLGKSSFKKLSDIASDINYFQRGSNTLTDNQLKKMKGQIEMRKEDLEFVVKRLENGEGEFKNQDKILRLEKLLETATGKRKKQAELMLANLIKERDTYTASKNALEQSLPALEKELQLSKDISKTRESIGGLATAAAGTISKYGGDLGRFLNVNDAIESVEEYNKKLIDTALKSDAVLDELHKNELKRIKLEAELEGLTGDDRKKKLDEINALEEDNLRIKQEAINSVNTFENKLGALKVLTKDLGAGLKKALTDPLTIVTYLLDNLLKGSTGIAAFEKELGLSYGQAYKLNTELNFVGNNVFDAYINGEKLKKSFIGLSQEMGFVADYGNEALVTMTNLTGKLGLSNKEAAQLTTLSRMQSTDTEAVLDNVGKTVSAMNKQGKTTFLLKDVMKEVANVSKAIAVSLGSNPVKIAEAVMAAKQLGTTLEQLESTADALLNFESSIESELKAELLTGKEMNLERARAAALANDMKALGEEIGKNEEVIGAFASGNRLAQQATAEALGMSREQLAGIVYQQEAQKLTAEGVRAKYGEQAYQQLKQQEAQEKFANAVEKLKTAFSSVIQIFSPLIDLLAIAAEFVANISSNWLGMSLIIAGVALVYLPKMLSGFAGIGKSIMGIGGTIKENFTKLFSKGGVSSMLKGGDKTKEGPVETAADKTKELSGKAPEGGVNKGKSTEGFLTGLGNGLRSFGQNYIQVLKGALTLAASAVLIGGALAAVGLAYQALGGDPMTLIGLGVAIAGFGASVFMLGKFSDGIMKGAVAMLVLGAAMIPFALSLRLIAGLNMEAILAAGAGLLIFGAAVVGLGALIMSGVGAALFGAGILGLLALGGAMIVLGLGLQSVSAGGKGVVELFNSLTNLDIDRLNAIAPALESIGNGILALGAGSVLTAIGGLLGGGPAEVLQDIANTGDGIQKAATSLQALAGALMGVSVALATLDVSKLETLDEFASNKEKSSLVGGITESITAPIKAIGEVIGGGKEGTTGIDLTPMIAAINEVKAAVDRLYSKDTSINMDSKKVGSTLVQGSYKSA